MTTTQNQMDPKNNGARNDQPKGGEGKASNGEFEQGSKAARDAGQKGGQASSGSSEQPPEATLDASEQGGQSGQKKGEFEQGSKTATDGGKKGGERSNESAKNPGARDTGR